MGKMEQAFKTEILRLTKKQFRQTVSPLSKDVKELKRIVGKLQRLLGKLDESSGNGAKKDFSGQPAFQTSQEEVKAARISSRAIKNIRKKLGISQEKLAALLDVSPGAVAFWEQGRAKPRRKNKAALVNLRRMGRRLVKKMLAEKGI